MSGEIPTLEEVNNPPAPPRPKVIRLDGVTPCRVDWLWPRRLPLGKVVVLDGDPSVGKSTLTVDMAAHVTTGKQWPDGEPCPQGVVLLLSAEDGLADTIAPRLKAAGGDPTRVHAFQSVPVPAPGGGWRDEPPSLPEHLPEIEQVIEEHGITLVVVDVLMAYLHSSVDSHKDQAVRGALHDLAALAERRNCCILLIRHLNKSGGGHALYRGGGSIGIVGAARAGFMVGRDPADPERRILAVTKSNLGQEPESLAYRLVSDEIQDCARVEWETEPVNLKAMDLLTGPLDEEEESERDDASAWLKSWLTDQGGEAPSRDVKKAARAAGFSESTLKRARRAARILVERQGFQGGSIWSLPPIQATEEPIRVIQVSSQSVDRMDRMGEVDPNGDVLDLPDPEPELPERPDPGAPGEVKSEPPCRVCGKPREPGRVLVGYPTCVACHKARAEATI